MPRKKLERQSVFLNIPYDTQFKNLYLAYIVSVSAIGFFPRATVGITGAGRLDRISGLIETCAYSVHDLSRVQLDRNAPRTPRFNMPFELGLAVAWGRANPDYKWFVFESVDRRLPKSLSDLAGTDPFIHTGTIAGVMREICNVFISPSIQPSVPQMLRMYRILAKGIPSILSNAGTDNLFTSRVFSDLCLAAAALRESMLD